MDLWDGEKTLRRENPLPDKSLRRASPALPNACLNRIQKWLHAASRVLVQDET